MPIWLDSEEPSWAILAADDDAKRFWGPLTAAGFAPEIRDGSGEGQTDFTAAGGERVDEDYADFLLLARELVDQKEFFAEIDTRNDLDQCAAGVEFDGGGVFVEG